MTTFFDPQDILTVGNQMAGNATTAAWTILSVSAPVAFGIALVRHATGARHPFIVLFHIGALALALAYYSGITSLIASVGQQAATVVGHGGNFEALLDSYQSDTDSKFKAAATAASSISSVSQALDAVTSFGAGLLSGLLTVLGTLAVIVALHLYQILQAVLYGVLVAVGPIVLAVSIVPGAGSLVTRWLTALFELAMWPVIGSVIFEMLGKAFLRMRTGQSQDFVTLFVCNIVLVFCVFLVPKIAERLVGSGFGAFGSALQSTFFGAAGAVAGAGASAAVGLAPKVGGAVATAVGSVATGAMAALKPPASYQPPTLGGPGGGFSAGPTLAEREEKPASYHHAAFAHVGPSEEGSAANAHAGYGEHSWGELGHAPVQQEQWQGAPIAGGARRGPSLADSVNIPSDRGVRARQQKVQPQSDVNKKER